MSTILLLFGAFGFAWGMLRPDGALPIAFGEPSRLKVAGLYGTLMIAGGAMDRGSDRTPEAEPVSTASLSPADSALVASTLARRDSLVSIWSEAAGVVPDSGSAIVLAEQIRAEALSLPVVIDAAPLDSLAVVVDERGRELGLYQRAQALPASDLEGNRDAYAVLELRYPENDLYRQKRESYEQRIRDREAARARRAVAASRPAQRSCCKYCSRGKPCGNSCISRSYTCRQPPGCAC